MLDPFARGRYATDASHYQIMPAAVATPRRDEDIALALDVAREVEIPMTMRGGGTSQCGQTINTGLVLDCSRHLNGILELDLSGRRARSHETIESFCCGMAGAFGYGSSPTAVDQASREFAVAAHRCKHGRRRSGPAGI